MKKAREIKSPYSRWIARVRRGAFEGDCWEWTGSLSHKGYGSFRFSKKEVIGAHRFSFEYHYGESADGWMVLHRCHNPRCCNPEHLKLGTNAVNMRDMKDAGRSPRTPGENNGNSKLTNEQVLEIRERWKSHSYGKRDGQGLYDIGCLFGISAVQVCNIVRGHQWADSL